MMPAFGTVLLVWRMFQNLLVIMGATLSVQAGKNEITSKFYNKGIKNPGAAAAAAKDGDATQLGVGDGELRSTATAVNDGSSDEESQANAQPGADNPAGEKFKPFATLTAKASALAKDTTAKASALAKDTTAKAAELAKPAQPAENTAALATVGGGGRAGRRRASSSMTKKINIETHRFKRSLKRHLHLRVPRFMPGGGTAFKSGYAAL